MTVPKEKDENMKWLICILCFLSLAGVALSANEMENMAATDIFLQEGSSGSFVNDSSGNYTLTINDVVPYTAFFADRPARDVGMVPMDKFLKGLNFGINNPPNAAMILPDENETSDMVVVELTNPQYNNTTKTLTYNAKQLKDYSFKSGWLQDHASEVDPAIPEKFCSVNLVIDGPLKLQVDHKRPDNKVPDQKGTDKDKGPVKDCPQGVCGDLQCPPPGYVCCGGQPCLPGECINDQCDNDPTAHPDHKEPDHKGVESCPASCTSCGNECICSGSGDVCCNNKLCWGTCVNNECQTYTTHRAGSIES